MAGRTCSATVLLLLFLLVLLMISSSSSSLYSTTDDVVVMDHSNFSSTICGTENAWVVEFYSSWCGHCIEYAPTWKLFAKDVKDWEHTIKVGVIDCAADENIPICRGYEIMAYPTIKLFAARTSKEDLGTEMNQQFSVEDMGKSVMNFLVDKQKANNGSSSWVNLQPYQSATSDIWSEVPKSVEHAVIIVDVAESSTAWGTILDLGGYSTIAIRLKEAKAEDTRQFDAASLPSVIFVDRTGREEAVNGAFKTRKELTEFIMKKLGLNRGMLPYKTHLSGWKSDATTRKEDMEGAGDGQPEEINSDKLNYEDDLPDTAFAGLERKDQVYMVDIENAISYALGHEVVQHKVIRGEALTALQNFLEVLVKYLPARPALHQFLSSLYKHSTIHGDSFEGKQLAEVIKSLQSQASVLPDHQPWVGCQGSEPNFRGYPCGLWITFHVLTVNSVLQDGNSGVYDPKKTLRAIHGYVKHFFSCKYCSEHFQAMYAVDAESSVNVADDGILWLWRGHNKVNKRIKGDASEDPKYPKQQFPSKSVCPSCWNGDTMKEKEALAYLKNIYAKGALSFKGTQTILAPVKNKQARVKELLDKHRKAEEMEALTLNKKHSDFIQDQSLRSLNTWGFNTTDISLCVILYGISTVIIMGVYCMVVIRRKMRRKRFLEAYKLPNTAEKRVNLESSLEYISSIDNHYNEEK